MPKLNQTEITHFPTWQGKQSLTDRSRLAAQSPSQSPSSAELFPVLLWVPFLSNCITHTFGLTFLDWEQADSIVSFVCPTCKTVSRTGRQVQATTQGSWVQTETFSVTDSPLAKGGSLFLQVFDYRQYNCLQSHLTYRCLTHYDYDSYYYWLFNGDKRRKCKHARSSSLSKSLCCHRNN